MLSLTQTLIPWVESIVITTKFIGINAIRYKRTQRVGTNVGVSKIAQIRAAIDEKPTMQKPLEIRFPANAIIMYHL